MKTIPLYSQLSVYVVIANEDEKVKECHVIQDYTEALDCWKRLQVAYGNRNVCFASRNMALSLTANSN